MESYDSKKTTNEVRQGNRKMTNMRVLLFSGVAVVIAFLVILWVFGAMAPANVAA